MRKLIIPALAVAMAFASSAFTAKKSNSNFYVYTSSSTAQLDIQNINNYASATDACPSGANVCGVTLSTSRPAGQQPVLSEFNTEKTNLWDSQQNHAAADGNISMKN